jgi:hypothetical protein
MIQNQVDDRNETFSHYKERLTNFSVEFEFGLFVHIAKKSLIWITLLFLIAAATSWFYLRYAQNFYSAGTTLQINVDNIYRRD